MDFSNYINSVDIRDYHRKIGYEYNSIEAAWIVWECRFITLSEKHNAWKWIINNMPDQIIETANNKNPFNGESFHKILNKYIDMQNEFIDDFIRDGEGCFYTYSVISKSLEAYAEFNIHAIFSNWLECVGAIKNTELSEYTKLAKVYRMKPNAKEEFLLKGFIEINLEGLIMDLDIYFDDDRLDKYIDLQYLFESFWLEFPTPFKKGDILYIKGTFEHNTPFVMTDIIVHSYNTETKRIKKRRRDYSDMTIWGYEMLNSKGYSLDDNYKTSQFMGIDCNVWWNYMNAEYYRKELTGINRCLIPVSAWLKGELDDLAILLTAYHRILFGEMYRVTLPTNYAEDYLIKLGLEPKKYDQKKG